MSTRILHAPQRTGVLGGVLRYADVDRFAQLHVEVLQSALCFELRAFGRSAQSRQVHANTAPGRELRRAPC